MSAFDKLVVLTKKISVPSYYRCF